MNRHWKYIGTDNQTKWYETVNYYIGSLLYKATVSSNVVTGYPRYHEKGWVLLNKKCLYKLKLIG